MAAPPQQPELLSPAGLALSVELSRLLTTEDYTSPIVPPGAGYDLERAEVLLTAIESGPQLAAVRGSNDGSAGGDEIKKLLEGFVGSLEAKFIDGRPAEQRPRARLLQAKIHAILQSLSAPAAPAAGPGISEGRGGGGGGGRPAEAGLSTDSWVQEGLCRTPTQAQRHESDLPEMIAELEQKTEDCLRKAQAAGDAKREALLDLDNCEPQKKPSPHTLSMGGGRSQWGGGGRDKFSRSIPLSSMAQTKRF